MLTVFVAWYISYKSPSDIDRIEIEDGEYLFGYSSNYIIDFKSNTLTKTEIARDSELEKITHFSDEDKENFVRKANMYVFFSWKESYSPIGEVHDGGYTDFLIIYNDGSQHKTSCYNAYPDTYDAMWEAIRECFTYGATWEIIREIHESDYEN